jgi:hypothetical protein
VNLLTIVSTNYTVQNSKPGNSEKYKRIDSQLKPSDGYQQLRPENEENPEVLKVRNEGQRIFLRYNFIVNNRNKSLSTDASQSYYSYKTNQFPHFVI